MRQATHTFRFRTAGQGLLEITDTVTDWTLRQAPSSGLLTLFCRHTSASLVIHENAAPAARIDLERFFANLAPESSTAYVHDDEGPDDMPAHIRTVLTGVSLSIPILAGRPALGVWQGVFLFEHRRSAHDREVAAHLITD